MRRGSSLLATAATPAAESSSAASVCCDHEAAHDTVSGAAAARSLELIGDLLDAGLDAGFVLVAAGSAGDADRADHLLADHDRQRAARCGEAGEILRAHLRIFLQPFLHLARRNAERARRVGLF